MQNQSKLMALLSLVSAFCLPANAGDPSFSEDVPIHLEALYKHRLNDNILLTPGVIWILSPNQDDNNSDVVIGALRMTFQF